MRNTRLLLLFASLAVASAAPADTLVEIYQLARQSDPTLRQADANRLAVREGKPQALGALLPQLTGGTSYTWDGRDSTTSGLVPGFGATPFNNESYTHTQKFDWSAKLTQQIFHWDQWVKLKQADKQAVQADLDYRVAELDLFLRVSTAYFGVLGAQDTLDANRAAREAIGRQLEQAQKRFEVGLIAITDVQEAQAGYDQAVAAEILSKRQLANAKEALRAITGQYPGDLAMPRADLTLTAPEPNDEGKWVETALQQNFGLQSAQIGADIARDNVRIAEGGHMPTIDLVAQHLYDNSNGYQSGTSSLSPAFAGDSNSGLKENNVSVQLNLPIFSGGTTQSRVRQAVYQHRAAKEKLEATARETERNARDSYEGVTSEIARVQSLKQSVKSAEVALEATQAGFEVGTRTTVDVLNLRQALVQAQTNYASSRYTYILDVLKLKQAAGTLAEQDVNEISGWLTLPTTPEPAQK